MNNAKKIKTLRKWLTFFVVIIVLGLLDIMSRQIKGNDLISVDSGYISLAVGWLFANLIGGSLGSFLYIAVNAIFDFWLIWLIVALILNRDIKRLERKTEADREVKINPDENEKSSDIKYLGSAVNPIASLFLWRKGQSSQNYLRKPLLSQKNYGWIAILGLLVGMFSIVFINQLLGSFLLLLGAIFSVIWLFKTIESKIVKGIAIFGLMLVVFIFYIVVTN